MTWTTALLAAILQAQDPAKPAEAAPPPKEPASLKVPFVDEATLGGQIRLRGEVKDPVDYRLPGANGRPAAEDLGDGDEYALLRVRAHLDLKIRQDLRAFVQLQDSRTFGEETNVLTDLEGTDLHQGWVEASNLLGEPLSIKAGRTEVPLLGDGRLISPLDWNNIGRAWDGAGATWTPEGFWVHGFAQFVTEDPTTNGRDQYFYGLYASYRGIEKHEFDAYAFARDFRNTPVTGEDGVTDNLRDQTYGVRLKGALQGFDYSAEADFQRGSYANDDVSAFAFAVAAGYTFDCPWKPRLGIELTRASGDDDPADGDRGTFDPLLSFAHAFHGYYDLVLWKNVRTLMISLKVQPEAWLAVGLDAHFFRLDEDRDAWYSAPAGAVVRRDPTGQADTDLGWEVDLHAKVRPFERTEIWAGVSHFHAGDFLEDTGLSPDGNFVYVQVTVNF